MGLRIAVCLVSLPDRYRLLAEAVHSVYRQTRRPDHLLVGVDYAGIGEVANMNRLIDAAVASGADTLAFLHDDDVWLPDHLAVAEQTIQSGADVAVARFRLVGRDHIEPRHDNFADLRYTNWFPPSVVVARADVFGRWVDAEPPPAEAWPGAGTYIDWTNWRRLHAAGAWFVDTHHTTAVYRFGPWGNGSWTSDAPT